MRTLREGSSGEDVVRLQRELTNRGFRAGALDGRFGPGTEAALLAFQKSEGLLADGVAGAKTLAALGFEALPPLGDLTLITVDFASKLFPTTPLDMLKSNLPLVKDALVDVELGTTDMALMTLATIRVEVGQLKPIGEFVSRFNTSPGGHAFDLYDQRRDLGNQGPPDGERYRGRGFVQLTGRNNYARYSRALGLGARLIEEPDLANEPPIASRIIARFLKDRERLIKEALVADDLASARRLVNGGSHGLSEFKATFALGRHLLAAAATEPASIAFVRGP